MGRLQQAISIVKECLAKGFRVLPVYESKLVVASYGIPVTRMRLVKSPEEAVAAADEIGYPVVLKIVSPDIVHKSDVGGVALGLRSAEEVRAAYEKIMRRVREAAPDARIEGILVEEMVEDGYEVIIGGIKDVQFGPVVMFGLGGIFVEMLRDVAFRVAPIDRDEALRLINDTKAGILLRGFRGKPEADLEALADAIAKTSRMLWDLRDFIRELDLNPVVVFRRGEGLKVVDARIVLEAP